MASTALLASSACDSAANWYSGSWSDSSTAHSVELVEPPGDVTIDFGLGRRAAIGASDGGLAGRLDAVASAAQRDQAVEMRTPAGRGPAPCRRDEMVDLFDGTAASPTAPISPCCGTTELGPCVVRNTLGLPSCRAVSPRPRPRRVRGAVPARACHLATSAVATRGKPKLGHQNATSRPERLRDQPLAMTSPRASQASARAMAASIFEPGRPGGFCNT